MVVSDLPSIREVVDERSAFLVTPDDPQRLAAGIEATMEGREEALSRANVARELVRNYTWQTRARKIFEAFGSL
jgi:glycosyltransferase involved in cell wall biosynthesis